MPSGLFSTGSRRIQVGPDSAQSPLSIRLPQALYFLYDSSSLRASYPASCVPEILKE